MNINGMQLSLKTDTFRALQDDFDAILNRTVGNMEMKGAEEATVTLKLKITLEKSSARDFKAKGYDAMRDIVKPSFNHDISSVMQVKDKKTGSLTGDYELVWDDDACKYLVRRVEDGQTSMFDEDKEDVEVVDAEVVYEVPSLMAPRLPIDVEETEISTEAFETMMQYTQKDLVIAESNGVYTVRKVDDISDVILSSGCEDNSPFKLNPAVAEKHIGHNLSCYMFTDDGKYITGISIDCTDCDETVFIMKAPAETYAIPKDESMGDPDVENDETIEINEVNSFDVPDEGYEYEEPEKEE